jgi:hypothetical protein
MLFQVRAVKGTKTKKHYQSRPCIFVRVTERSRGVHSSFGEQKKIFSFRFIHEKKQWQLLEPNSVGTRKKKENIHTDSCQNRKYAAAAYFFGCCSSWRQIEQLLIQLGNAIFGEYRNLFVFLF